MPLPIEVPGASASSLIKKFQAQISSTETEPLLPSSSFGTAGRPRVSGAGTGSGQGAAWKGKTWEVGKKAESVGGAGSAMKENVEVVKIAKVEEPKVVKPVEVERERVSVVEEIQEVVEEVPEAVEPTIEATKDDEPLPPTSSPTEPALPTSPPSPPPPELSPIPTIEAARPASPVVESGRLSVPPPLPPLDDKPVASSSSTTSASPTRSRTTSPGVSASTPGPTRSKPRSPTTAPRVPHIPSSVEGRNRRGSGSSHSTPKGAILTHSHTILVGGSGAGGGGRKVVATTGTPRSRAAAAAAAALEAEQSMTPTKKAATKARTPLKSSLVSKVEGASKGGAGSSRKVATSRKVVAEDGGVEGVSSQATDDFIPDIPSEDDEESRSTSRVS